MLPFDDLLGDGTCAANPAPADPRSAPRHRGSAAQLAQRRPVRADPERRHGLGPSEVNRTQVLILSTQGGIRAPDGTPVALGYHTGHWEVELLMQAAAEQLRAVTRFRSPAM